MTKRVTGPARSNAHTYLLRLPPELKDRLRQLAEREGVSLNTLILMLLASGVGFNFEDDE
jgi:predicted HicB family RNase H-like nuclease